MFEQIGVAHHPLHSSRCLWLPAGCFLLSPNQWKLSRSQYHQPGPVYFDFCNWIVSVSESGNVRCSTSMPSHIWYPFVSGALASWGSFVFLQGTDTLWLWEFAGGSPGAKAKNLMCKMLIRDQHIWTVGEETDWTVGKIEPWCRSEVRQSLGQPSRELWSQYCPSVLS